MIVVVVEIVEVVDSVEVNVMVWVVEKERVVHTSAGTMVDVNVLVIVEVEVEVGVGAVEVEVCLTSMISTM